MRETAGLALHHDVTPRGGLSQLWGGSLQVCGYFDADFRNDKARSGVVILVDGNPSAWRTSRQVTITLNTQEAEITAASLCAREVVGLCNVLEEVLGATVFGALYGDNEAANLLANGQTGVRKVRHLDLAQLYVQEVTADGKLRVHKVHTAENPANQLTKVLGRQAAERERGLVGLRVPV